VVVVGLPFPNLGSPELQERMKYVKSLSVDAANTGNGSKGATQVRDPARELYENMCMNAVNQSIGRSSHSILCFMTFTVPLQVVPSATKTTGHPSFSWITGTHPKSS
jgi:hypothetical protein